MQNTANLDQDPVVIVSVARTPQGNMLGALKDVTAPQLGSVAIAAAIERAKIDAAQIDEVIMGCVLPAGLGQAPARQASLGAGIPKSTGCTTINKMCGSGMKAVMLAHDLIKAGTNEVMVAGGMESMSNGPYLVPKGRGGYRFGHGQLIDHTLYDGLEDAYDKGKAMGVFAEATAEKYNFSRADQDKFAITSVERAQKASADECFAFELAPVTIKTKKGDIVISVDEGPTTARIDKIPTLAPAFVKDGTVTAANSSSISDGAAALVLMRQSKANSLGLKPLAKIIAHSSFAHEPAWFTTAPVGAIKNLLDKVQWTVDQVDLFEINEAFAVVTMAAMHDVKIPHEKVNVHGGACILGHPIGASGARIIVTLVSALKKYGKKRGVAALCIGGGEATAIAIENIV